MMFARSVLRNFLLVSTCLVAVGAQAQEQGPESERLTEELGTESSPAREPEQEENQGTDAAAPESNAPDAAAPPEPTAPDAAAPPEPTAPDAAAPDATPTQSSAKPAEGEGDIHQPASDTPVPSPEVSRSTPSAAPNDAPAVTPDSKTSADAAAAKAPGSPPGDSNADTNAKSESAASPSSAASSAEVQPQPPSGDLTPEAAVNYALSYSLDWTYVLASAGLRASGVWDRVRPPNTWLGPNFQEDENSLSLLQEPRLFGAYNQPMRQEKVSVTSLVTTGSIAVALATSIEGALIQDAHRAHVLGLGALVTTVFSADLTEVFKLGVGRLRPDFAERYQRAACQGITDAPTGLDCTPFNDGFVLDEKDYIDGFKSFPSGHASTSFALATYLSLWLNRTWVFGKHANAVSQPLAVLASGLLYSGAFFSAASRVADHRHHLEDVAVGAALGTGIGAATWLLYFDTDGEARERSWTFLPQTYGDGGGVALSGTF